MSEQHVITVRDSCPFDELTPEEVDWLRRLQAQLLDDDHVIRLQGPASEDPEPVVFCDASGTWRAGRFIGSLAMDGVRLDIGPRFEFDVLLRWVDEAFEFIALPNVAQLQETSTFVPWLLAMLWSRRLDVACRHGLPSLRTETEHEGLLARGRLDVRATVQLQRRRPGHLATRTRERTLDNDIARTLICAENALRDVTRSDQWQPRRVRDLCGNMRDAVGARPRLPTEADLSRIRYTPIRLPFRALVEFSHRLARRRGYMSAPEAGKAEGVLLDVAELWELFVVGCTRDAARELDSRLQVSHGTRALRGEPPHLLYSSQRPNLGLGQLFPDVLVSDERGAVAVLDAKYKRLAWAPDRPDGVDRGDRYQLAAYLSKFRDADRTVGALIYPMDPEQAGTSKAEQHGPWLTADHNHVWFVRVRTDRSSCRDTIRALLSRQLTPLARTLEVER